VIIKPEKFLISEKDFVSSLKPKKIVQAFSLFKINQAA